MNIQKAEITLDQRQLALTVIKSNSRELPGIDLRQVIREADRNVVVIGAGAALSGVAPKIQDWCERNQIPYVSSWGAMTYLDRSRDLYYGSLGVYGARSANWLVQAADNLIVFGRNSAFFHTA
jgi:thiamine pyrophosphate-dependent acetolactate synthase large subunit-like protein